MRLLKVYLFLAVLSVTRVASADDDPAGTVNLDLAQNNQTKVVIAGEHLVRIINTKPDKKYLRADGQELPQRAKPSGDPPACSNTQVLDDVDKVAADPAQTESDVGKAVDSFVNNCKPVDEAKLRGELEDRTAIAVGNYMINLGASIVIAISDSNGGAWTFTITENHLDLDLASSSGAFVVAPGTINLRLANAIPGQTYNNQVLNGVSVTVLPTAFSTDCEGVDEALKGSTEAKAAAAVNTILKDCSPAKNKSISEALPAARSVAFESVTVQAGESEIVKVQTADNKEKWTFSITGDSAKAASSAATSSPEMDKLQKELAKAQISGLQPTTSVTCKVTDSICPAVYVSASAQSLITITDVAKQDPGKTTVVVTASETWYGEVKPTSFIKTFDHAPAQIVISLHSYRKYFKILGAERFPESAIKRSVTHEGDFAIDFVTQGRSEQLAVTVIRADGSQHAIDTRIKYQQWFVDTGGFIVLTTTSDQELVTSTANGSVSVLKKRNKDRLTPGTGAVLDFHPANYPRWAAVQFGLATSQDRQLSYYLGTGYRLLEIGSNALATFAVGLAAVPSLRFPDVKVTDVRPQDDAALKGSTVYRFGPYISFSFGFRFGDIPPAASNSTGTPPSPQP